MKEHVIVMTSSVLAFYLSGSVNEKTIYGIFLSWYGTNLY